MDIKVGDRLFPRTGKMKHVYIVKDLNFRGKDKVLMHREGFTEEEMTMDQTRIISMNKIHLYDKLEDKENG